MRDLLLLVFCSHHIPEEYDHCVRFGPLPVCARCLGIYPIAFALLLLQLGGHLDLSALDPWGVLVLPLPAVVEFLLEQWKLYAGSNLARIATGLPLGVALSRLFVRYLHHPTDPFFWGVVAVYGGLCGLSAAFALRKRLVRN